MEGQNVSYEIKIKYHYSEEGSRTVHVEREKLQDISGLVMDVMGEPIVGVNVMEKGTTNGTITDMNGKFYLKLLRMQLLLLVLSVIRLLLLIWKGKRM